MLSKELLKQAAEELALALIESLPEPEQCQHQFSENSRVRCSFFLPPSHPIRSK